LVAESKSSQIEILALVRLQKSSASEDNARSVIGPGRQQQASGNDPPWYTTVKRAERKSLSEIRRVLDPIVNGNLLAAELPKPIENEEEFERMADRLEELDFGPRELTPEEVALREILAALLGVHEKEHHHLPEQPPYEMVRYPMEQRGLKQADLVPVPGTRSQVSDGVTRKRGISKAQAKKLAGFFQVSVELFI
jgi:HTH-type transcriptional regulator/antitoxin HigA